MAFPRLVGALALTLVLLAAGCISKGEETPEPVDTANTTNETPDATLPDDRGTAIAFNETNKTEEGVGGIDHKHDYWQGETRAIVYEGEEFFRLFPVMPDGEGSQPASIVYIKPPQPSLVYEGAASIEVLVAPAEIVVADGVSAPHPIPPSLTLQYRTAASDQFVDAGPITAGSPLIIPVSAKETDMPHSVSSLWAFAIKADSRQDASAALNVTITAVKGSEVVDWPGHPEFYADKDERVIAEKPVSVHRQGIEEGILYGSASSWVHPDKLVSYGTGYLDVFVNVTSASSSTGAEPTGFFLEYHNATILDAEDEFNDRIDDEVKGRQFDHQDYHFVVPVDPAGMDGPYQSGSLWAFRMVATFAETPAASLCPGCFAYDIEYTMTIVAHKATEEQARINE